MRTKTLLLCLLSLFVISSCSSSDDDNGSIVGPEVKKQIKRLSSTQLLNSGEYETTVIDFVYENDKVVRWDTNQDVVYHFSYEGDKLKMITTTDGEEMTAYYEGDRLVYTITKEYELSKENCHYNAKGQLVSKTCEAGYSCRELYPVTYAYTGNNMTTTTLVMEEGAYKEILSYDSGINPFKNYDTNFRIMVSEMIYLTLSDNNPRQQDVYLNNSSELAGRIVYENTYDKDNYPITVIGKRTSDRQTVMTHRFEYF